MLKLLFDTLKLLLALVFIIWLLASLGVAPALKVTELLELPTADLPRFLLGNGRDFLVWMNERWYLSVAVAPTVLILAWCWPEIEEE